MFLEIIVRPRLTSLWTDPKVGITRDDTEKGWWATEKKFCHNSSVKIGAILFKLGKAVPTKNANEFCLNSGVFLVTIRHILFKLGTEYRRSLGQEVVHTWFELPGGYPLGEGQLKKK